MPGSQTQARLIFTDHHESHAASAFFPSPFEQAAILTLDGVGEWSTATLGVGEGNRIRLLEHIAFPHSLGLLYSAFTYYCGFKVNSGEYKLMGLAPYGRPIYQGSDPGAAARPEADGSFWLDMAYFNYCQGLTMTNRRFHRLFGGPPRGPSRPWNSGTWTWPPASRSSPRKRSCGSAGTCVPRTGTKHLVLAGGVALNCVANGRLLREGEFDDLWIQPAAGDAGGALGAALFVWYQLLDNPRRLRGRDSQQGSFLGPSFTTDQFAAILWQGKAHPDNGLPTSVTCSTKSPACSPTARSLAGSRAAWSSGPDRWDRAAFWAIPDRRPCRRP